MKNIDLTKIKYYPDRFYICLDGFDIQNLTTFITDLNIGEQHAIFIHEYYHYLTNISTYAGIRQFHLNFCDRFRIVTNLTFREKLKAYPINTNSLNSCKEDIEYWQSISQILDDDDIDYALVNETQLAPSKKFEIVSVGEIIKPMDVTIDGKTTKGGRKLIRINIDGLTGLQSFILTFGALDEFLSSSIDEYLFENDLSEINPSTLSQRPFYPYNFFDSLLLHYGIVRASAFEKILIVYFALSSDNPAITLINVLENLKSENNYTEFQINPEEFLLRFYVKAPYDKILDATLKFAKELEEKGSIHISQAMKYFYDKFYSAQKFKESDFFYFIRPFFVNEVNTISGKQKFLLALSRIINQFSPPVILKDHGFHTVDKLTNFGESTMHIIATYEIFESLKTEVFAKRPPYLKEKYTFPDNSPHCDDFKTFLPPPITSIFQLALNDLNLFKVYLEELERINDKNNKE